MSLFSLSPATLALIIAGVAMVIACAAIGISAALWWRSRHLDLQLRKSGDDPSALLRTFITRLDTTSRNLHTLASSHETVRALLPTTFAAYHLERYDPLNEVGVAAHPSFSLALLTRAGDGIILTALHARDRTRIYAKEVRRGTSPLPLSKEERRALDRALASLALPPRAR